MREQGGKASVLPSRRTPVPSSSRCNTQTATRGCLATGC